MAQVAFNMDGTYTSFSGADAVATFNGRVVGELQAITANIQREKGPIYVMGNPDPISFSRGKRGIAGNLVFVMCDRDGLLEEMENVANLRGTIPQYTAAGNLTGAISPGGVNVPTPVSTAGIYTGLPLNSQFDSLSTIVQFNNVTQLQKDSTAAPFVQLHGEQAGEFWVYEDQIPPFDITITLANEYGSAANIQIHQAEILNEGMGISIDDINLERACTFVARSMSRLRRGFTTSGQSNTASPIAQSFTSPGGSTANGVVNA
jgi:hypothetical protein